MPRVEANEAQTDQPPQPSAVRPAERQPTLAAGAPSRVARWCGHSAGGRPATPLAKTLARDLPVTMAPWTIDSVYLLQLDRERPDARAALCPDRGRAGAHLRRAQDHQFRPRRVAHGRRLRHGVRAAGDGARLLAGAVRGDCCRRSRRPDRLRAVPLAPASWRVRAQHPDHARALDHHPARGAVRLHGQSAHRRHPVRLRRLRGRRDPRHLDAGHRRRRRGRRLRVALCPAQTHPVRPRDARDRAEPRGRPDGRHPAAHGGAQRRRAGDRAVRPRRRRAGADPAGHPGHGPVADLQGVRPGDHRRARQHSGRDHRRTAASA